MSSSSSLSPSTELFFGFSIAIHCSTNVLKDMCFFLEWLEVAGKLSELEVELEDNA